MLAIKEAKMPDSMLALVIASAFEVPPAKQQADSPSILYYKEPRFQANPLTWGAYGPLFVELGWHHFTPLNLKRDGAQMG